jgi:hypothetical protein
MNRCGRHASHVRPNWRNKGSTLGQRLDDIRGNWVGYGQLDPPQCSQLLSTDTRSTKYRAIVANHCEAGKAALRERASEVWGNAAKNG